MGSETSAGAQAELPATEHLRADLLDRLRIDAPGVVEEVLKLSLRQFESEERRYLALVGKAQAIVGQASVAVGLVSSLIGGVLLREGKGLQQHAPQLLNAVVLLVILSLALGILAVLVAAVSQRVSESRELGMDDILSRAELDAANATHAEDAVPPSDPTTDSSIVSKKARSEKGIEALQRYRRFIIAHVWVVRGHLVRRHGKVAKQVMVAQWLFWGFVLASGLTGILLSSVAFISNADEERISNEQRAERQQSSNGDAASTRPSDAAGGVRPAVAPASNDGTIEWGADASERRTESAGNDSGSQ